MEDTSKYCRMGVGYPFWEISKQNFETYCTLKKEYAEKCDTNNSESVWENSELEHQKDYAGFIAIVFSAIYLESEAYTYLATNLTDSYVKTHLEKLDPLSKWVVGIELITGNALPKGGQAYEHCKNLFKFRNKLTHHKSKPMEWDAEKMAKLIEQGEEEFDQAVMSSNLAVRELAKIVNVLHDGLGKPLSFVEPSPLNKSIQPTANASAD
jgi:hypothetical protein